MSFAGELWDAWVALEAELPPRHHLLITGPTKFGMYTVGVVQNTTPTRQIARGRGDLTEALRDARDALQKARQEASTDVGPTKNRRRSSRR